MSNLFILHHLEFCTILFFLFVSLLYHCLGRRVVHFAGLLSLINAACQLDKGKSSFILALENASFSRKEKTEKKTLLKTKKPNKTKTERRSLCILQ